MPPGDQEITYEAEKDDAVRRQWKDKFYQDETDHDLQTVAKWWIVLDIIGGVLFVLWIHFH